MKLLASHLLETKYVLCGSVCVTVCGVCVTVCGVCVTVCGVCVTVCTCVCNIWTYLNYLDISGC